MQQILRRAADGIDCAAGVVYGHGCQKELNLEEAHGNFPFPEEIKACKGSPERVGSEAA